MSKQSLHLNRPSSDFDQNDDICWQSIEDEMATVRTCEEYRNKFTELYVEVGADVVY